MVKVKSEIMCFLVNASPPKQLHIATSNFADAVISSKAGIWDCVPSTDCCFLHVLLKKNYFVKGKIPFSQF